MEITVLSPASVEVNEKDIQSAFERNLTLLDEGLEFIGSEVVIGTGRIDTLAYDSVNNRPVFIEYKGPGAFGRDALIQLMDYLSWFSRDENRMAILEKIIRQRKLRVPLEKEGATSYTKVLSIQEGPRLCQAAIPKEIHPTRAPRGKGQCYGSGLHILEGR
jgi:RecB family endonuclease NucS